MRLTPGCCCVDVCNCCPRSVLTNQLKLTLAGAVNGAENECCAGWNGVYYLDRNDFPSPGQCPVDVPWGSCAWQYFEDTEECDYGGVINPGRTSIYWFLHVVKHEGQCKIRAVLMIELLNFIGTWTQVTGDVCDFPLTLEPDACNVNTSCDFSASTLTVESVPE